MKKIIYLIMSISLNFGINAQTTFWTETFGTDPVCGSQVANNYNPSTNGNWTAVSSGANDTYPNVWYISPKEAGMGVGNCGDGCDNTPILINRTLHVSSDASFFGDIGASYAAIPGASNTNFRAQSPTINCSGKSGIVLNFSYIMWGLLGTDYAEIQYSPDNGVTWSGLGTPAQTATTAACSGQAVWASYSVALPASANNNSIVKVGFRWENTSSTGSDPSFAVDDVVLTYSTVTSASLTPTFSLQPAICRGDSTQITASTGTMVASGYTWTANPAGPVFSAPNASVTYVKFNTTGTFSVILTATSGTQTASTNHTIMVNPSPTITASSSTLNLCIGQSATLTAGGGVSYTWTPGNLTGSTVVVSPTVNTSYVCTGSSSLSCKSSTLVSITSTNCSGGGVGLNSFSINDNAFSIYPNPLTDKMILQAGSESLTNVKIEINDALGKKVMALDFSSIQAGSSQVINTSTLPKGIYFVNVSVSGKDQKPIKVVKE